MAEMTATVAETRANFSKIAATVRETGSCPQRWCKRRFSQCAKNGHRLESSIVEIDGFNRKAMAAMDSLDQRAPECAEIPRFDDGMVNIQELIRIMAESLVNEIMDAQAEDACADGNRRNGYRERALVTSVGTINLRIPKLRRGSYFPEDLLTRYSRVDRAVVAAVSEMVTCGVSTRKVERVAASLGIDRMSASQVSRICESLDDVVADLQERDLSGTSFPYIWVDATYVKCRDGGHVSSCALVTAIGACSAWTRSTPSPTPGGWRFCAPCGSAAPPASSA